MIAFCRDLLGLWLCWMGASIMTEPTFQRLWQSLHENKEADT